MYQVIKNWKGGSCISIKYKQDFNKQTIKLPMPEYIQASIYRSDVQIQVPRRLSIHINSSVICAQQSNHAKNIDIPDINTRIVDIGPTDNNNISVLWQRIQQRHYDSSQQYFINSRSVKRRNKIMTGVFQKELNYPPHIHQWFWPKTTIGSNKNWGLLIVAPLSVWPIPQTDDAKKYICI